jgi:peptidase M28-like protein
MPFSLRSLRARVSGQRLPHSSVSWLPALSNRRTSIIRHLQSLVGERHPHSAPQALTKAGEYLAVRFAEYGWTTTRQAFRVEGKIYRNILAVKHPARRAASGKQAPLLIGAHYDTVMASPGADDNASGLTVLLEVADRLKRIVVTRPVWLVAFCLEEQGLLGSQTFAARLKKIGHAPLGAIILECVGYASHEPGSQLTPPGVPIPVPTVGNFLGIIGNETSRNLVSAVERGAKRASPHLPSLPLVVPSRGETLPDVRRSDHAAFWDEGYSAVMLTDTANFRNPHYHQPTDTIDTLDLNFLEGVIESVIACIQDLAGSSRK